MNYQRKRVAKRLASGLLAGALALGGLAISGGTASAKTPSSPSTNRIAGADRYETAVAIARSQIGLGSPTDGLVIATGESSADALAAAVLTTDARPMLLVRKDSIPASVADFIADHRVAMSTATVAPKVYVIGGESAVSKAVLDGITAAVTVAGDLTPTTVTRISGADRYATAKAISDVAGITDATDTLIIANGEDGKWADALSAGALSSKREFPIVLTNAAGLEASAKAKVDSYLATPGSSKKFLIVGGPAVVSTKVEEYLIGTKLVAPANIRRIGGADRYNTNLLFNVYLLTDETSPFAGPFNGQKVALVSGESPFDALVAASWAAKDGVHLALTNAAGGNSNTLTLSGSLEVVGGNATLFVIGGRSAVADSAKSAYIAASTAVNMTSTLSGCTVGSNQVVLALSGKLTSTELAAVSVSAGMFTRNLAAANAQLIDTWAPGGTKRKTFVVGLATPLTLGETLRFGGFAEGDAVPGTLLTSPDRSIAASSCTAAPDTTRPTASLVAISGASGVDGATTTTASAGAHLILTTDELVTLGSGATASISAGAITVGPSGATNSSPALVEALNSSKTRWLIQIANNDASWPTTSALGLNTVTINAAQIKDVGGNSPATNPVATALGDAVGPVLTAGGVACESSAQAQWTAGNLTLKAASLGSLDGAGGNLYTLSVINQRGRLAPSVAIDATAKTIVVTADVNYHTVADVRADLLNNFKSNFLLGDIDVTATSAVDLAKTLSATVVPATSLLSGKSFCEVTLNSSEPFYMNDGFSVSVGGLSSGYITGATVSAWHSFSATGNTKTNLKTSRTLSFTTSILGSASVGFLNSDAGVNDTKGNRGSTPVLFTVS